LNRRQKITINGSLRLNPSARGVTATVLGRRDAQGVILVHMPSGQTINSDLYTPTLKILQRRFRRIGLTEMLLLCYFSCTVRDHKEVWKHGKESQNSNCSSPTIQPRSCSFRCPPLCNTPRCHPWENVWEGWRSYWRRGCEYTIQTGTRRGQMLLSLAGKGSWSSWKRCSKIRYKIHPSQPTSMVRELYGKLRVIKDGVAKMFWATIVCNTNLKYSISISPITLLTEQVRIFQYDNSINVLYLYTAPNLRTPSPTALSFTHTPPYCMTSYLLDSHKDPCSLTVSLNKSLQNN
jgi:hypothetical protein